MESHLKSRTCPSLGLSVGTPRGSSARRVQKVFGFSDPKPSLSCPCASGRKLNSAAVITNQYLIAGWLLGSLVAQ